MRNIHIGYKVFTRKDTRKTTPTKMDGSKQFLRTKFMFRALYLNTHHIIHTEFIKINE